ncbi:hypothetical protein Hanom_Chr05g00406881 [Helianthus anomalus]
MCFNPIGVTDNSRISDGASRHRALATGLAPGITSIRKSISRLGGSPGRSSGNT